MSGVGSSDVVPVPSGAVWPFLRASSAARVAARVSSILRIDVMKSWKISAGYVPPATGLPRYSVSIGFSRSG